MKIVQLIYKFLRELDFLSKCSLLLFTKMGNGCVLVDSKENTPQGLAAFKELEKNKNKKNTLLKEIK